MMMKNAAALDLAERRERELNRVSGMDLALDKELDDLLLELNDADDSAEATRDILKAAANSAKAVGPAVQTVGDPQHDPAKHLVESYYFPDVEIAQANFMGITAGDRLNALKVLLSTAGAYHQIRDEYCALSLAMNECGEVPPKFRLMRPLPRRTAKATPDDTLMMRDRQVIDMHWLHCRGKRDAAPDKNFANLFTSDDFDFDLAAVLAAQPWRAEVKAEKVLNLIPHEQLQLAILRTKAVADAWQNAESSVATTIDRRLREQAISTPSLRPHIEDFKQLWLADKIKQNDGLAAIAEMYAWISGKPRLATSTLCEKLRRMRRRTAAKTSKA